jgi:hypothetical protein
MTALHQLHVMVCSSQWSTVRLALNCTKLCVASVSQHYFSDLYMKNRLSAAGLHAQFVVIAGTAPRDGCKGLNCSHCAQLAFVRSSRRIDCSISTLDACMQAVSTRY